MLNVSLLLLSKSVLKRDLLLVQHNDTPLINPLILKGHLKSLSQINTAQVLRIDLNADTPTQVKPSFTSEKCKFWVKNTVM
jgi:hypothetical protein